MMRKLLFEILKRMVLIRKLYLPSDSLDSKLIIRTERAVPILSTSHMHPITVLHASIFPAT
jgi:hypothetical protein